MTARNDAIDTSDTATAVYMRVSTRGQSVRSQRQAIARYLEAHAMADAAWYVDEGISGATLDRPALDELNAAIFRGEVQTVVVYALDRLARTAIEGLGLIAGWLKQGIRLIVITMQIDFSGEVGQMIASLLLHIAQMERTRIRERQAAGIAAAKAAGKRWGGRRPGQGLKAAPDRIRSLKAKGLTNREVATALGISERTVIRHARDE